MDPRIQIRIRIHTKLSWNRNNAFFKAVTSTVTNLCFWRAKEEIEALVAENKALKEELAEMRSQEKRRKLLSPASDKPKLNIKGIIFLFWYLPQSRQSAKLFLQSSELGLPHPLPAGECAHPPLWLGGGGGTLAYERGVGGIPIPTREHTQWYSVYISTLWYLP
jgi:hypothetical protein